MKFAETELRQITQDTWRIVLDEEVEVCEESSSDTMPEPIAACAQISGDWQLAIVLRCSEELAQGFAATLFSLDQSAVTVADTHDAMCELINIVAGNVKGVLNGSSHLSLPNLVRGQDFSLMFPRHVVLGELTFSSRGKPFVMTVLGEDRLQERLRAKHSGSEDEATTH